MRSTRPPERQVQSFAFGYQVICAAAVVSLCDPDKHMLACEYAQGVWRFTVDGNKMDGTLTRPDRTIFRRVTLKKEA